MSDGNWMTGLAVTSLSDLCSTSHCSLKTIYCQWCKPTEAQTNGEQNRKKNGKRMRDEGEMMVHKG